MPEVGEILVITAYPLLVAEAESNSGQHGSSRGSTYLTREFFLINLRYPELVGGRYDKVCMLAAAGFKGAIDMTVIYGKIIVRERQMLMLTTRLDLTRRNRYCGMKTKKYAE